MKIAVVITSLVMVLSAHPRQETEGSGLASEPACIAVAFPDDPPPQTVPRCDQVANPTVLNCYNSSSMCVTAITPGWVCDLDISTGVPRCRCRKP